MSAGVRAPRPLARWVKLYLTTVVAAGVTVITVSLFEIVRHPPGYQWYLLAALTLISGSATVNLPSTGITISVSETFVFFSVLLFGPSAGTVMVALDGLVISFWLSRRNPEWYRPLFNMAAPAVSLWIAAHILFAITGSGPLLNRAVSANSLALPLAVCAVTYFGLNSWLIAVPTAALRGMAPFQVWRESSLLLSLNYLFGAALALLLIVYTRDVDITFVAVIIPLLLVSYLTYKTTVGRIADANDHLAQVNRLYLSTVETLAMAIDAKDQVTHGHIRRVQVVAVNLAKELGIRDTDLIKAIEAAALLHDMGKLAVPEYILNKPGRLTAAEFDRMKLHASVGADILSAIDFPYPVVPIVRHHHESWDGTGYPDGLKGTEIPIGARILSVVDCFDALTSDRPYRPRLSDSDAIQILNQRRGTMYDPLIVDTFVRVHTEIAPQILDSGPSTNALDQIATARRPAAIAHRDPVFDEIAASADEMLTLYELSQSLLGQISFRDASDVITNHLRRLIPGTLYVFYVLDSATGQLEARHAIGEGAENVRGLRINLGQRLSGWVAAHRQTICNSDPVLDFGEAVHLKSGILQSCLSTPLCSNGDALVGVLSVYANAPAAFNEDHKRVIEAVSRQLAETLRRAAEFDATPRRDELTGLPNARQLEQILSLAHLDSSAPEYALIFVAVQDLHHVTSFASNTTTKALLHHVVQQLQRCVRVGDVIFRYGDNEFVLLLNRPDYSTTSAVAQRIQMTIRHAPAIPPEGAPVHFNVSVGFAFVPTDGRSLSDLIVAAKRHGNDSSPVSDSSIH
jgi:diguanylate cyclase (GGDEF)-like protein/putative nucleotidyltransferase with HDIG domain